MKGNPEKILSILYFNNHFLCLREKWQIVKKHKEIMEYYAKKHQQTVKKLNHFFYYGHKF